MSALQHYCRQCDRRSVAQIPDRDESKYGEMVRVTCPHCDFMELVRDGRVRHEYGRWSGPKP
jgi:RNase P subunit RPR2